MKKSLFLLLVFAAPAAFSQNKIRNVEALIDTANPAWPYVLQWIDSARNKVEILAGDPAKARTALYKTQVTTRSPMGAIIFSTGGLLIDDGWIRILGSGNPRLKRSLPDWNKGKSFKEFGESPSFLLVADDAVGGFFAINGREFGKDLGKIYYLSPDKLKWEPLDITYSEFLSFCFDGDLKEFYKELRWENWQEETSKLDGNKVYTFHPFLWTKEGKDINRTKRKIISVQQQYRFNINSRRQLGLDKADIKPTL